MPHLPTTLDDSAVAKRGRGIGVDAAANETLAGPFNRTAASIDCHLPELQRETRGQGVGQGERRQLPSLRDANPHPRFAAKAQRGSIKVRRGPVKV
ncbi:MAG: hypothetical protein AAFU85_26260 [Planctomycetota bacterium]